MKTIYELTIRSNVHLPGMLSEIVTKHNQGRSKVDLHILEAYILADKAAYPSLRDKVSPIHHTDTGTIEVVEEIEGEVVLQYTILEKMIEELKTETETQENKN